LWYEDNFPQNINASQGTTQQVNLTLTSRCPTEIVVPFENLTIYSYYSDVDYNFYGNYSGDWRASAQETVFNYSFSLSQLTLQPFISNSTVLTINLANNAPLGSYSFEIYLGEIVFLPSSEQQHYLSYSTDAPMVLVVTANDMP